MNSYNEHNSGSWIRTNGLRVMSPTSFQLLYPAIIFVKLSICFFQLASSKRRTRLIMNSQDKHNSGSWIRTNDLRVMSPTSFQLLYPAIIFCQLNFITLSIDSEGGARTHSLPVNSRLLHHWATSEWIYPATTYFPRRLPAKYHQRWRA